MSQVRIQATIAALMLLNGFIACLVWQDAMLLLTHQ